MPKRLVLTPSRLAARFIDRLQQTMRGRNAIVNVFELWVGMAGILSGVSFFYSPASLDHNSVAVTIGYTAAACWITSYLISGILIWHGLLRPSPKWEIVGLWMLGSATAANSIAILYVFDARGVASAAMLAALTLAAWTRALIVQTVALRFIEEHRAKKEEMGNGR